MAEETATGSITLADPNNGPLVRWAATVIERHTTGLAKGVGFTVDALASDDMRTLTITIQRNEKYDVKELTDG